MFLLVEYTSRQDTQTFLLTEGNYPSWCGQHSMSSAPPLSRAIKVGRLSRYRIPSTRPYYLPNMLVSRGHNHNTYIFLQLYYQQRRNRHWQAPTPSDMASTSSMTTLTTLTTLPPELLLNTIPFIEYHPETIRNLALTCKTFHSILTTHETSLVRAIKLHALPPNTLPFYPSLPTKDYASLAQLHSRQQTLEQIHTHWLHITSNTPDLSWLKGRWEHVHKAGLLLLYRLQDTPTHDQRLAMLASWPATTLACLMFKLVSGVRILRIWGAEPVKVCRGAVGIGSGLGDEESRCDVELCCEEMMLVHGPGFFVAMLEAGRRGEMGCSGAKREGCNWAVR